MGKMKLFAGILFGLVLAFQLFNLTTISLWHDEAFSALLIRYDDYGEMLHRIGLDVHPPLYYMILRIWASAFGDSLFSLRSFSLFFGLLGMAATFALAKEIFQKRNLAFFSALILGMNSFQIQYHLEARMYTLATFFILLATFFLIRGLKTQIPSWRFSLLIGAYALSGAAALYTHYYSVFALAAHALFALYLLRFQIKKLGFVGVGFVASGILFLPWLPTFLRQLSQVQASYWIPPINRWSIPTTISKMTTGDGFNPDQAAFLIILIGVLVLAAFLWMLSRYPQRERWILPFLFLMPFLGSFLLSLKTSIYLDRYFIFYLPYLVITLVAALFAIPNPKVRSLLLMLALAGATVSYPLHASSWRLSEKPGMAGASSYLLSSLHSQDTILATSSFVYFTFRYYNTSSTHPLVYAPSDLPHFSGTALLNKEDIARSSENIAQPGNTVWTIDTTGFGNFQPAPPESWQKLQEKEFPDAYPHRGSVIVRKYLIGI